MNKITSSLLSILLFIVIAVSCSRTAVETVQEADLVAAQKWFSNSKEKLAKQYMNTQLTNGKNSTGSLSWQNARSYQWRGFTYIEVPYLFNQSQIVVDGKDTMQYSLVLRVINPNQYVGALGINQTSTARILGTDSTATIHTKTYTYLNGKEANSWMNDGSRSIAIKPKIKSEKETAELDAMLRKNRRDEGKNTAVRKAILVEECETYEVKYSYAVDCYKDENDPSVCIKTGKRVITDCYYYTEFEDDPFPSGGGGGGGVEPTQDSIWNDVENKCLRSMVNNAIGINLKNQISVFLNNAFGASDKFNLRFLDREIVNNYTKDAETYINYEGINNSITTTIRFNNNALKNASMEYVVATIFHEAVHAWIDYFYPYSLDNKAQHEKLADSFWFNKMQNALMELFPKMSASDAENLTWGGLQYSLRYQLLNLQEKQNVINTNRSYRNSSLGTSCDD